jgi:hypothetical protein
MSMEEQFKTFSRYDRWKWLGMAAIFALCVGPTFISYQPYLFEWDDSDYLRQSIAVSRAFWSLDRHGLGAMVTIRPPAMTLLGLPWGPLTTWDAAGKCFITLAALTALLAALCLYLLLRIGVKPFFLVAASVCVFASLGPCAPSPSSMSVTEKALSAYFAATAFLADSLLAWTALAALLLIPYETRTQGSSRRGAFLQGIVWGSILSLGVMTKISFLYFVVLIVPVLLVIRLYYQGPRSALAALAGFVCSSVPSAFYLALRGRTAFDNAKASSFGGLANFYYVPLSRFVASTIRETPGLLLSLVLIAAALTYLVIKRRTVLWSPDFLAFMIVFGFVVVVLAAPNRQIRYAFPGIVALPFLTAILMSGKGRSNSVRFSALAAAFVFCGLATAAVPMRRRTDSQSLSRSDAVLAQAAVCNAKRVVLATDSPTLSISLMTLAIEISTDSTVKALQVSTLANQVMLGVPIQKDFREINEADQVVFQDRDALDPPFTNLRVSEYEQEVRQSGYLPAKVGDLTIYSRRCKP